MAEIPEEDQGMKGKIRVLIAKADLDGHDRGAEDVDAIGVSILSGAQTTIFPRILHLMKEKNLSDVLLFGGGLIPDKDIAKLKEMGVGEPFSPGTSTTEIIRYVMRWTEQHRN
jgi:methylmalonyl-CoA mutase C-terminal domain/subunit